MDGAARFRPSFHLSIPPVRPSVRHIPTTSSTLLSVPAQAGSTGEKATKGTRRGTAT